MSDGAGAAVGRSKGRRRPAAAATSAAQRPDAAAAPPAQAPDAGQPADGVHGWPSDYVPGPQSHHDLLQLALPAFVGPLDLLLLLIRRHRLDIFDIPLDFVCRQYLACLAQMQQLAIDVAAEFMHLAAELLAIKSRTLLPEPPPEEEEGETAAEVDPRTALVLRLLEHQKYKDAAAQLHARPMLGRDTFAVCGAHARPPAHPAALRPARVLQLAQAFHQLVRRQQAQEHHQVTVETVSVRGRMQQLVEGLAASGQLSFVRCVGPQPLPIDVLVTFLALLEMTRMQLCELWQDAGGQLWVQPSFASLEEGRVALKDVGEMEATH